MAQEFTKIDMDIVSRLLRELGAKSDPESVVKILRGFPQLTVFLRFLRKGNNANKIFGTGLKGFSAPRTVAGLIRTQPSHDIEFLNQQYNTMFGIEGLAFDDPELGFIAVFRALIKKFDLAQGNAPLPPEAAPEEPLQDLGMEINQEVKTDLEPNPQEQPRPQIPQSQSQVPDDSGTVGANVQIGEMLGRLESSLDASEAEIKAFLADLEGKEQQLPSVANIDPAIAANLLDRQVDFGARDGTDSATPVQNRAQQAQKREQRVSELKEQFMAASGASESKRPPAESFGTIANRLISTLSQIRERPLSQSPPSPNVQRLLEATRQSANAALLRELKKQGISEAQISQLIPIIKNIQTELIRKAPSNMPTPDLLSTSFIPGLILMGSDFLARQATSQLSPNLAGTTLAAAAIYGIAERLMRPSGPSGPPEDKDEDKDEDKEPADQPDRPEQPEGAGGLPRGLANLRANVERLANAGNAQGAAQAIRAAAIAGALNLGNVGMFFNALRIGGAAASVFAALKLLLETDGGSTDKKGTNLRQKRAMDLLQKMINLGLISAKVFSTSGRIEITPEERTTIEQEAKGDVKIIQDKDQEARVLELRPEFVSLGTNADTETPEQALKEQIQFAAFNHVEKEPGELANMNRDFDENVRYAEPLLKAPSTNTLDLERLLFYTNNYGSTMRGATSLTKYGSFLNTRKVDEALNDVNAPAATLSPYSQVVKPTMSANASYKLNIPIANVAPPTTNFRRFDQVGNQVYNPPHGKAPYVPLRLGDTAVPPPSRPTGVITINGIEYYPSSMWKPPPSAKAQGMEFNKLGGLDPMRPWQFNNPNLGLRDVTSSQTAQLQHVIGPQNTALYGFGASRFY
jgi:hypothetical protein